MAVTSQGEFLQFEDRRDAGRRLAAALQQFRERDPIVVALPRGGVPVAYEIAEAFGAPLDIMLVRKIGAPGHPEYGLGAVVDGHDPQTVLNEEAIRLVQPPAEYLADEQRRQLAEIERRRALYRHGRPALPLQGRTVILVDDGIATGGTVKAALKALSRIGAAHVVLAVPLAPPKILAELVDIADDVVCLASPVPFHAVGIHYRDFEQTGDAEVIALLDRAAQRSLMQRGPAGPHGLGSQSH
jgi:putative phosphoribosyl transferase